MKIQLSHNFEDIVSVENLLEAWREFLKGKRNKKDVQYFSLRLMDNILKLYSDLLNHTYKHGEYQAFHIFDPKPRHIHKALVRDRLIHHAIYRILYPFFDRIFISDSFSCRKHKGTHKALNQFRDFSCKVSKNDTQTCWILKCDIRKFFDTINHETLMQIIEKYIPDESIIWLLRNVVESFSKNNKGVGLPLGNLTSQLFVNVYMNEFDQFLKHKLKVRYYIRYADDFVILSDNKICLESSVEPIQKFLKEKLKLQLHPDKIYIKTLASGIDFLGWVNFLDHRVLRTATKKRMIKNIKKNSIPEVLNSYLGLLKHGNAYNLQLEILKRFLASQEPDLFNSRC